ncbi:MAG: hypothetical protein ABH864_02100 [archaeon]
MRAMLTTAIALLVTTLLVTQVSASYLTGDIYLKDNGEARFKVETDIETEISGLTFQNNQLTGTTNQILALKGGVWSLNISMNEYDDIYLNVHLPNNLISIRSIEGSDSIIDIEEKVVTIADSGKLDFAISYRLKERKNYSWAYWLAAILILTIGFFTYKKVTKKKERLEHIMPMINEKEQQVIDILMKKPMRQKELRKTLNLPKASFSRYMVSLEKKKLILREGEGKNKIVRLK